MGAQTKRAVTRVIRLLKALDAAGEAGMSTPQLVDQLDEVRDPKPVRQTVLTWYGGILRHLQETGQVHRAGRTAGGWQQSPAIVWTITPAGRQRLTDHADAIRHAAEQAAEDRLQAARATERERALGDALEKYGPHTPRPVRRPVVQQLRDLGCTLEQIGEAFGLSREMIRLDLLDSEARRSTTEPAA